MSFELDSKKYEQSSAHRKEWGKKLISGISFKGNEHILDLGCGDGTLTAFISALVPNGVVYGIDASYGMIEVAQQKAQNNLKFLLMDINDLHFVSRFDIVISNSTLHWIKDHKKLLNNAINALRDGGQIRFNFAGDGNSSNLINVIKGAMLSSEYAEYFLNFNWPWYMPSLDEYSDLVRHSGLKLTEVSIEKADRYFKNEGDMIKWIDQPCLVPFISNLPDSKREAFRNHIIKEMIENTRRPDGRCFETFRRINLSAKKD